MDAQRFYELVDQALTFWVEESGEHLSALAQQMRDDCTEAQICEKLEWVAQQEVDSYTPPEMCHAGTIAPVISFCNDWIAKFIKPLYEAGKFELKDVHSLQRVLVYSMLEKDLSLGAMEGQVRIFYQLAIDTFFE